MNNNVNLNDYKQTDGKYDVMTAAEVCAEYNLEESTVRQAIRRGSIPARKSGDTWLVIRADAEARWGGTTDICGVAIENALLRSLARQIGQTMQEVIDFIGSFEDDDHRKWLDDSEWEEIASWVEANYRSID